MLRAMLLAIAVAACDRSTDPAPPPRTDMYVLQNIDGVALPAPIPADAGHTARITAGSFTINWGSQSYIAIRTVQRDDLPPSTITCSGSFTIHSGFRPHTMSSLCYGTITFGGDSLTATWDSESQPAHWWWSSRYTAVYRR
jgi:hypothetical protein